MDRLSLHANERKILGKKVKVLRRDGKLPAHVFGKGVEGENVIVAKEDFIKTFTAAGETGLIDLKISKLAPKGVDKEKVRPVLIRDVQYDPIKGEPVHIDFYQVDLSKKVKVSVPLVLVGEQPESVHLGETIVLQTLNEVEVEALPTDLVEKIEVDISSLKVMNDAITIGQLTYDRNKLTIHAPEDEIIVKLAPAVTAQMEKLLQEEAAEAAAAVAETTEGEEGKKPEGEEVGKAAEAEESKEGERGEKAAGESKAGPVPSGAGAGDARAEDESQKP